MDIIGLVIILIAVVSYLIYGKIASKGVKQLSTTELKNKLKRKEVQFIDVRTAAEFKQRKITSFKNIPLHELAEKGKILSKEKEVIVICQSGMRSKRAAQQLKKMGFTSITNVKGGMNAWI